MQGIISNLYFRADQGSADFIVKVDLLFEKVLKLQQQKQEYEARQIFDAYKKSGKTLAELLTFLDV